jgi:hypothetical protein
MSRKCSETLLIVYNRLRCGLAHFKRVRGLDREWKLLRRPAEHNLSNLTPLWANWNFRANRSNVVSGGIRKGDVNVSVCFYFYVNNTSCECVPFLLRWHSLCRGS